MGAIILIGVVVFVAASALSSKTKKCSVCRSEISKKALVCPYCGDPK